jgi:hypothetical protein
MEEEEKEEGEGPLRWTNALRLKQLFASYPL